MTDLDAEARAAVAALVHRLRNRGDEDGQFSLDDELFAAEFVTALRGYGWRPLLVAPAEADWRKASGSSRLPDAAKPGGDAYLAAKAALAARVTGPQQVLTEDGNP
jgi:hypothetical protein